MGIESTSKWSEMTCIETTLYRINNWTPFVMVDHPPSFNCWFSSQQSVYTASNAKRWCLSWLNIIKKHLGRGNLMYCFQICFPISENIPLFLKCLNKIHATKFMQAYIYILVVSFSYYIYFVSKSKVKFCGKSFPLLIIYHYHWTQN